MARIIKTTLEYVLLALLKAALTGRLEAAQGYDEKEYVVLRSANWRNNSGGPVQLVGFRYLLNPLTVCKDRNVTTIIVVHSSIDRFKKRMAIRHTWAKRALLDSANMALVFVLGEAGNGAFEERLQLENERYSDLVQVDFKDRYRNLTYKFLSALSWLKRNCDSARYVLKIDDDVVVNLPKVFEHVGNEKGPAPNEISCFVKQRSVPSRRKRSRWYVSEADYPLPAYPVYCNGCYVLMEKLLALALLRKSFETPILWIDDVYVTGILAKLAGAVHKSVKAFYLRLHHVPSLAHWNDAMYALTSGIDHMYTVWKAINKQRNPEDKEIPRLYMQWWKEYPPRTYHWIFLEYGLFLRPFFDLTAIRILSGAPARTQPKALKCWGGLIPISDPETAYTYLHLGSEPVSPVSSSSSSRSSACAPTRTVTAATPRTGTTK